MGDIFHEQSERDLFFSTFATDLGSQLDQLRFEYEAIENGTIKEEEELITEDKTDASTLENKVQTELLENNIANDGHAKEHKERTRTYTMTIQRAFSTVSLMTNFKSNFWKRRHGKNKKGEETGRQRRSSTSSTPEKNNNHHDMPDIKINGESEGRATIYSTVPRPSKNINRSQTLSPSKLRPSSKSSEPEQLERSESGNVFVPPVIMNGRVMYEYQYATPEASPVHKSAKMRRRNSLTRLLRIRKSPKKSPNKSKDASPIKQLYEKTVLTASNNSLHKMSLLNADNAKPNGDAMHTNGEAQKDKKNSPTNNGQPTKVEPAK